MVDFTDLKSGIRVIIVPTESGLYQMKTYYNNIPVDIKLYEFGKDFLVQLHKALGECLG